MLSSKIDDNLTFTDKPRPPGTNRLKFGAYPPVGSTFPDADQRSGRRSNLADAMGRDSSSNLVIPERPKLSAVSEDDQSVYHRWWLERSVRRVRAQMTTTAWIYALGWSLFVFLYVTGLAQVDIQSDYVPTFLSFVALASFAVVLHLARPSFWTIRSLSYTSAAVTLALGLPQLATTARTAPPRESYEMALSVCQFVSMACIDAGNTPSSARLLYLLPLVYLGSAVAERALPPASSWSVAAHVFRERHLLTVLLLLQMARLSCVTLRQQHAVWRRYLRGVRGLEAEERDYRAVLALALPSFVLDAMGEGEAGAASRWAEVYPDACVLFAEVMEEDEPPTVFVHLLGRLYSRFDALVLRAGCLKVDAVGLTYTVAAGVPDPRADHATALARLAGQMMHANRRLRTPPLALRIGIHSGPVVGGVIGAQLPRFRLFGATMSACRGLTAAAAVGTCYVSEAAADLLSSSTPHTARGAADASASPSESQASGEGMRRPTAVAAASQPCDVNRRSFRLEARNGVYGASDGSFDIFELVPKSPGDGWGTAGVVTVDGDDGAEEDEADDTLGGLSAILPSPNGPGMPGGDGREDAPPNPAPSGGGFLDYLRFHTTGAAHEGGGSGVGATSREARAREAAGMLLRLIGPGDVPLPTRAEGLFSPPRSVRGGNAAAFATATAAEEQAAAASVAAGRVSGRRHAALAESLRRQLATVPTPAEGHRPFVASRKNSFLTGSKPGTPRSSSHLPPPPSLQRRRISFALGGDGASGGVQAAITASDRFASDRGSTDSSDAGDVWPPGPPPAAGGAGPSGSDRGGDRTGSDPTAQPMTAEELALAPNGGRFASQATENHFRAASLSRRARDPGYARLAAEMGAYAVSDLLLLAAWGGGGQPAIHHTPITAVLVGTLASAAVLWSMTRSRPLPGPGDVPTPDTWPARWWPFVVHALSWALPLGVALLLAVLRVTHLTGAAMTLHFVTFGVYFHSGLPPANVTAAATAAWSVYIALTLMAARRASSTAAAGLPLSPTAASLVANYPAPGLDRAAILGCIVLAMQLRLHWLAVSSDAVYRGDYATECTLRAKRNSALSLARAMLPAPVVRVVTSARLFSRRPTELAWQFPKTVLLRMAVEGFPALAARCAPEALCSLLHELEVCCDAIATRSGLDKFDTAGDAVWLYAAGAMTTVGNEEAASLRSSAGGASAGLGSARVLAGQAARAVRMAVACQDACGRFEHPALSGPDGNGGRGLRLTVGLHVGPTVTAIVGLRGLRYSIYSPALSVVTRLEQACERGRLHCTQSFVDALGAGVLSSRASSSTDSGGSPTPGQGRRGSSGTTAAGDQSAPHNVGGGLVFEPEISVFPVPGVNELNYQARVTERGSRSMERSNQQLGSVDD